MHSQCIINPDPLLISSMQTFPPSFLPTQYPSLTPHGQPRDSPSHLDTNPSLRRHIFSHSSLPTHHPSLLLNNALPPSLQTPHPPHHVSFTSLYAVNNALPLSFPVCPLLPSPCLPFTAGSSLPLSSVPNNKNKIWHNLNIDPIQFYSISIYSARQ